MDKITVKELWGVLNGSWNKATSNDPEWTISNPSRGQCAVTALVVNDFLGGDIIRCEVYEGAVRTSHYFNRVDGKLIDLTRDQFEPWATVVDEFVLRLRRELLADDDTNRRYKLLRNHVAKTLGVCPHCRNDLPEEVKR